MKKEIILMLTFVQLSVCDESSKTAMQTDELDDFEYPSLDMREGIADQILQKDIDEDLYQSDKDLNLIKWGGKPQVPLEHSRLYKSQHQHNLSRLDQIQGIKDLIAQVEQEIQNIEKQTENEKYLTQQGKKPLTARQMTQKRGLQKDFRKLNKNAAPCNWGVWSDWSPCSVTCGQGKKERWRFCAAEDCKAGEVEMGEKICRRLACNVIKKYLGV